MDLYAWLEESRGDWKGLSEALGPEAPAKVEATMSDSE